jgi:hypothetical protein
MISKRTQRFFLNSTIVMLGFLLSGCAIHNVKFTEVIDYPPLTDQQSARVVYTRKNMADGVGVMFRKAFMPHLDLAEKNSAACDALIWFCNEADIGSYDYKLVGELYGGGNAYTNWGTMERHLSERAAKEGGDLCVIYNQGAGTVTLPGYSSTTVSRHGRGSWGATTFYSPPRNVQVPIVNALVLRYVKDYDREFRQRFAKLSSDELGEALKLDLKLSSGDDIREYYQKKYGSFLLKHVGAAPVDR